MPRSQSKRWLALLLASALLHGMALHLAGWRFGILALPSPDVVAAQLQLRQVTGFSLAPTAAVAPPPKAEPRHRPKPRSKPAPAAAAPLTAAALSDDAEDLGDMADMAVPGSGIEPASALAPEAVPAEPAAKPAADPALQQAIDPPPSALLKYDVQSSKGGKAVYGSGKIAWHTDGNVYTASGEASVLFFTVLEFRSEGAIDRFGVAPGLYTEKRFRKPATNTHFQRDPQIISFSASTLTYPRQGGEQDRASVTWQLAALGRGDSSRFAPGAQIEVVVAGVRDAEPWRIRVIGLEQIRIPAGEMPAWHLERQPRAGSFDQKIDIWLAPQQQWYPVRLRYTDNNGDYLDMAASGIEPDAPPAVREY
ncbi:DUF3108 domain-containing protein [Herminiimonas sp. CN]|uniref:DUF3108 domain-containing protein n=1 Tax=Herminiimonas sp. CN TaxID=1349818 RepID=UPI0012DE3410|nr:DUF3108 domain-containing protein [Herminiimonas sp. CN]